MERTRIKTSDQIILFLGRNKQMTKLKLSEHLGISRPTLDARLKDNTFSMSDLIKLQSLGII